MSNRITLRLISFFSVLMLFSTNLRAEGSTMGSVIMNCDLETSLLTETWGAYQVVEDGRSAAFNGDVLIPFGSYSNISYVFNGDGSVTESGNATGFTWSLDCATQELTFNGNVCAFDGEGFLIPIYTSPGIYIKPITANHEGCTDTNAANYDFNAVVNQGCVYPVTAAQFSTLVDGFWEINTTCAHDDMDAFPLTSKFGSLGGNSMQVWSSPTRGRNSNIAVNSSIQGIIFQGGSTYSYLKASLGYTMFNAGIGSYQDAEISFYYDSTNQNFVSLDACYTIDKITTGCDDPTALNYNANAAAGTGECFYELTQSDLEKTYEQTSVNESCLASYFSNERYFGFPVDAAQQELGRILSFSQNANGTLFYTDVEIIYDNAWYQANPNYTWGWGPSITSENSNGFVRFGDASSGMTLVKGSSGEVVAFHNFWTIEFGPSWTSDALASDLSNAGFMFDDAFCINSVWTETSIACSNPTACNYSETADLFLEGYCEYPVDGFDCAGNCIAPDMNGTVWSYYDWNGDTNSPLLGTLQTTNALSVDVAGAISGEGTTQNTFISQWQCGTFDLYNMTFANGGITFNYVFDGSNYFWAASYTDSNTGQTAYLALVQESAMLGCTDATACNYDAAANMDNGACVFAITENILTSSNWAAESGFTCGATENYLGGNVSTTGGNQSYLVFNVDYTGEMFNYNQGTPISITTFTWALSGCEVVTSVDLEIGVDGFALNANGKLVTFFNDAAAIPSCYNIEWAPFQEMGCADANACNYVDPAPDYNTGCQYPQPFFDCAGNCLVEDLTNTTWDLYGGTSTMIGALVEASVLTLNAGGSVDNQSVTGFSVGGWTQNCGMISFTSSDPSITFQQVMLTQDGLIQVMYFNPNIGGFMQQVLIPSGSIIGCMNPNACNFDPNATISSNYSSSHANCTYPQAPGYDCDGVCQVSFDVSNTSWDLYSAINSDNTLEGMQADELLASGALNLETSSAVSGSYFAQNNTWTQNCGLIQIGDGVNEPTMLQVVNNGQALFMSQYDPNTNSSLFFIFLPSTSSAACTDPSACNYDAAATETDNTLCTYPEAGQDCDGNCFIEGAFLRIEQYDCNQFTPFEVNETNSPGAIQNFELVFDGMGGVIINEYIPGSEVFTQQTTTYTYDNCVLSVQGIGNYLPQEGGYFIPESGLCGALIPGTIGCIRPDACNYDPEAYADGGEFMGGSICQYPNPGYDCDGVCQVSFDVSNTSWDINVASQPMTSIEESEVVELLGSNVITFETNGTVGGDYFGSNYTWTQDCGLIVLNSPDASPYFFFIRADEASIFFSEFNEVTQEQDFYLFTPASVVVGCNDASACNYDAAVTEIDNTLCTYPLEGQDCDGNVIVVLGCTYPSAINYNAAANDDDGTCEFPLAGCTDANADNYAELAVLDDGSCLINGEALVYGCTNADALNFQELANVDDASCVFSGNCPYDFNSDGAINSGDLLVFLGVFGSTCEP